MRVGASLLAMVAGCRSTGRQPRRTSSAAGRGAAPRARSERRARGADRRDSDAYDGVVAAFRLPKDTDDEKTARSGAIQEALRGATEAPLDVMRQCAAAIEQASVVAAFGNPNAASDVQVALELLGAGLRGAGLNVEINLGSVKDAAYVGAVTDGSVRRWLRGDVARAAAARARLTDYVPRRHCSMSTPAGGTYVPALDRDRERHRRR